MLHSCSENLEKRCEIDEFRDNFIKKIRDQERQNRFEMIRKNAALEHLKQLEGEGILLAEGRNQFAHKYYRDASYRVQVDLGVKYRTMVEEALKEPKGSPNIMPEISQNIYFQKNGFVIYRRMIGSGSYSHVWQGKIKSTGEKIAAKQLKFIQENEFKYQLELKSDHIVKVLDVFTYLSKCYIILEFCDGTLKEELNRCNFRIDKVLKYFEEIIYGMDVLQKNRIIHRDLKFENILVKDNKVKIADFGFAKYLGNQLEVESRRCGSPYTMAPEVYFSHQRSAYTIKSDIWAIGILLHEMLYQIHPFQAMEHNLKKRNRVHVNMKYGILDKIIDRCLEFNPAMRISWTKLKELFNCYLQEKPKILEIFSIHYRQSQFEKRIQPAIEQHIKLRRQVKIGLGEQRNIKEKEKIEKQRERKDVSKERTPSRKKPQSKQKKEKSRDKFENDRINKKGYVSKRKYHFQALQFTEKRKDGEKKVENRKNEALNINLMHNEQLPLIPKVDSPATSQPIAQHPQKFVLFIVAILIVIFATLYISFGQ